MLILKLYIINDSIKGTAHPKYNNYVIVFSVVTKTKTIQYFLIKLK